MPKTSQRHLKRIAEWRAANRAKVLEHKRRYYRNHRQAVIADCCERRRNHMRLKTETYARGLLAKLTGIRGKELSDELVATYAAYLKLRSLTTNRR